MFPRFPCVLVALVLTFLGNAPASARNISVVVGGLAGAVLNIVPNQVKAAVGDVIVFEFRQKNHTITQSSFNQPCTASPEGIVESLPVPQNQTSGFPIRTFVVEKTDPYWMYCAQATHCQEGMVFAINPGNNFSSFQQNALALAAPSAPAGVSIVTSTVTSTVTVSNAGQTVTVTASAACSPTSTNSTSASDSSSSSSNLSKNGANDIGLQRDFASGIFLSAVALVLGTML